MHQPAADNCVLQLPATYRVSHKDNRWAVCTHVRFGLALQLQEGRIFTAQHQHPCVARRARVPAFHGGLPGMSWHREAKHVALFRLRQMRIETALPYLHLRQQQQLGTLVRDRSLLDVPDLPTARHPGHPTQVRQLPDPHLLHQFLLRECSHHRRTTRRQVTLGLVHLPEGVPDLPILRVLPVAVHAGSTAHPPRDQQHAKLPKTLLNRTGIGRQFQEHVAEANDGRLFDGINNERGKHPALFLQMMCMCLIREKYRS